MAVSNTWLRRKLKALCDETEPTCPIAALVGICPPSSCTPFSRSCNEAASLGHAGPFPPRPREQSPSASWSQPAAAVTASNLLSHLMESEGLLGKCEAATDEAPTESCQSGKASGRCWRRLPRCILGNGCTGQRKPCISQETAFATQHAAEPVKTARMLQKSSPYLVKLHGARRHSCCKSRPVNHNGALSFRGETVVAGMMSACRTPWPQATDSSDGHKPLTVVPLLPLPLLLLLLLLLGK